MFEQPQCSSNKMRSKKTVIQRIQSEPKRIICFAQESYWTLRLEAYIGPQSPSVLFLKAVYVEKSQKTQFWYEKVGKNCAEHTLGTAFRVVKSSNRLIKKKPTTLINIIFSFVFWSAIFFQPIWNECIWMIKARASFNISILHFWHCILTYYKYTGHF